MHNDRLEYVTKVLEALDNFFAEATIGGRQGVLYSSTLLLEDDTPISEAINKAFLMLAQPNQPLSVPRSQRRRVARNFYGNWVGFIGKRKVMDFKEDSVWANKWLNETD
jgi:hypothetical protein